MKVNLSIMGLPKVTYTTTKSEAQIKGEILGALEAKTAWENPSGSLIGHNLLASAIVSFEQEEEPK